MYLHRFFHLTAVHGSAKLIALLLSSIVIWNEEKARIFLEETGIKYVIGDATTAQTASAVERGFDIEL